MELMHHGTKPFNSNCRKLLFVIAGLITIIAILCLMIIGRSPICPVVVTNIYFPDGTLVRGRFDLFDIKSGQQSVGIVDIISEYRHLPSVPTSKGGFFVVDKRTRSIVNEGLSKESLEMMMGSGVPPQFPFEFPHKQKF